MTAPELITIGFSHYCEKARWALDRSGLDYVENAHVPLFHAPVSLRAGAGRTVPALKAGARVLRESTDVLRYADEALPAERRLFPDGPAQRAEVEGLVAEFDRSLGPATRRFVYYYLLQDPRLATTLLASSGPAWERRLTPALFPAMRFVIRRGLKITDGGVARSRERIEAAFASVADRLADGRRFLVGERFGAADLTFASLAAPVLAPATYGHWLPSLDELPAEVSAFIARQRETPAGRFVLRLYAEERPPVRGRPPRSNAR